MNEIKELISKIDLALKKQLFLEKPELKKALSYKEKEKEYYAKEINNLITKTKSMLLGISLTRENMKQANEALKIIDQVEKMLEKKNNETLLEAKKILTPVLDKKFENPNKKQSFVLPSLPKEIESEIRKNFSESQTCFDNSCYRSVLILCGKILEIALHKKYFEITGRDLLEKAPDIGLGNLVKKMKEKGFDIDPGLSNQIHLINQLRVYSVHKKSQVFEPSENQALATLLYTLDTLKKLFK